MIPECSEKWDWALETNLQGHTSKSININIQLGFVFTGSSWIFIVCVLWMSESPRAGLGTRFCTPHSLGLEDEEEVSGGLGSGSGDEHSDLD